MNYDTMQWTIIGLAVFMSAVYAVRKLAPNALRRTRTKLALMFLQPGSSSVERTLGRWLAPKPQSSGACGSTSCNGCGDSKSSAR
ncbi:MAG TPA: DUF6587 family protein [Patescibacteria group bacterium]|nr:hypothetical protein [Xanthomonadales bacterium]MBP7624871.1 hypothetical protein [Xanthomonadales bacterium]HWT15908.1 DUF6587 family protein [Patescibacteria group bacterium]